MNPLAPTAAIGLGISVAHTDVAAANPTLGHPILLLRQAARCVKDYGLLFLHGNDGHKGGGPIVESPPVATATFNPRLA